MPHLDLDMFWRRLAAEALGDAAFDAAAPDASRDPSAILARFARAADSVLGRRDFLSWVSASLALAGATGCRTRPAEQILPYVRSPAGVTPGVSQFYATSQDRPGGGPGLLVESREGRPVKIEGNPSHPASLGATDASVQASILDLYDPDRSAVVTNGGEISTWDAFRQSLAEQVEIARRNDGAGLRFLTPSITSPTFGAQLESVLARLTRARWHVYEPCHRDNVRAGSIAAFGQDVRPVYYFGEARIVVALDSDLVCQPGTGVRYAHDLAGSRRGDVKPGNGITQPSRLYVVESSPTPTGIVADHRLRWPCRDVGWLALELEKRLNGQAPGISDETVNGFLNAVVDDLQANPGRSLVVAGDRQPAEVHAAVHRMNERLGNQGRTVEYIPPPDARSIGCVESIESLVDDLTRGRVETLLILDGNPAYATPEGLGFARAISAARWKARLGTYEDETSALCDWHVPQAHYLESWGDTRAFDGTAALTQPLVEPLYGGKSAMQVVAEFQEQPAVNDRERLREFWRSARPVQDEDFELFWRRSLHDGLLEGTAHQPVQVALTADSVPPRTPNEPRPPALEVSFAPDPFLWDGRQGNNAWLLELPRPSTRLTWDNPALVSPSLAESNGLQSGDVIELTIEGATLEVPVYVLPGQSDQTITLHFGFGRRRAGRVGTGVGVSAFRLWPRANDWWSSDVRFAATGKTHPLASVQGHHTLEGRDLIRTATWQAYLSDPDALREKHEHLESLYPEKEYEGFAWGMSIDLSTCTACSACVVACQAENNVPTVGKAGVLAGREMHWLRIDRYFEGQSQDVDLQLQPVLCMHCEQAPCEVVCPVNATVHSEDGLNQMVYNRCVGTRYCSHNCPYKVRRFNFFDYHTALSPVERLLFNPEVTLRAKGVMEKCTYCIQRISAARIEADKAAIVSGEHPTIADGSLQTACQQACPSAAITFGDLNDPQSRAAHAHALPHTYGLLAELNTRPRTTYLTRLRNPHPGLAGGAQDARDDELSQSKRT